MNVRTVLDQLERVSGPTPAERGDSWKARCPVHDDHSPSLSVTQRSDGSILVHCFAGCAQAAVRQALGLSDSWVPDGFQHQATYPYTDIEGNLLFEVLRGVKDGRKSFLQRVKDPEARSGWIWTVKGLSEEERSTPFMAPAIPGAIQADETVYVVEGEKDVMAAMAHGLTATCNVGGAGRFRPGHAEHLRGARVVVVQDNDDSGRKHGAQVCRLLTGVASSVHLVDVHPDLPEKADLSDHLAAGFVPEDLVEVRPGSRDGVDDEIDRTTGDSGGAYSNVDSEASERLVNDVLRERYCWTASTGWLRHDKVWRCCTEESVVEAARQWAKGEVDAALRAYDPAFGHSSAAAIKRAQSLLSKTKLKSIVELSRGQLERSYADFDTDPDILVAGNGVVDLRTGELTPHDPAHLVTRFTPVDYVPGARHQDWDIALNAVDEAVAGWLQARLGQAITGYVPEDDLMLVFQGGGENGKSTVLSAVLTTVGDYGGLIPDKVLLADKGNQHPTELMTLKGKRIAVLEETPEGRHLDMTRIKKVLGTAWVVARFTHKDNTEFRSSWAIVISTNYTLVVNEVDHGSWRRLARVNFRFRFRDVAKGQLLERDDDRPGDANLRDRVQNGGPQQEAVLAWLVEGARRWYAEHRSLPRQPESVKEDTLAWRKTADQWLAFADDNLVLDPNGAIWLDDLQRVLSGWQRGRGHRPWSMATFRGRLEAHPWMDHTGVSFSGQQVRDPKTLDRPGAHLLTEPIEPAPGRPRCLLGARFRTEKDVLHLVRPQKSPLALPTTGAPDHTSTPPACGTCGGQTRPHPKLGLTTVCPTCFPDDFSGVA